MPTRSAHAEWNGPIDSGEGRMAFGSGAFDNIAVTNNIYHDRFQT